MRHRTTRPNNIFALLLSSLKQCKEHPLYSSGISIEINKLSIASAYNHQSSPLSLPINASILLDTGICVRRYYNSNHKNEVMSHLASFMSEINIILRILICRVYRFDRRAWTWLSNPSTGAIKHRLFERLYILYVEYRQWHSGRHFAKIHKPSSCAIARSALILFACSIPILPVMPSSVRISRSFLICCVGFGISLNTFTQGLRTPQARTRD